MIESLLAAQIRPDGLMVDFPAWYGVAGLIHGVTTRAALPERGKSDLFRVIERARDVLAIPAMLTVGADQVHADRIVTIEASFSLVNGENLRADADLRTAEFPATDALVTARAGVLLVIQTADCLPVFLIDPVRRIAGLAHCGWRGLRLGLAGKTAGAMLDAGAAGAGALQAWLGPCIRAARYEVGPALVEEFRAAFPGAPVSPDGTHLDLAAIVRWQLEQAGLKPENIYDSGQCTLGQPERYHSYRGENEHAGRLLSFLGFAGPTEKF